MSSRRVVVTGLGAVTSLGLSAAELWSGLCAGRCGIGRIKAFDPSGFAFKLAGEVPAYRIQDHIPKSLRKSAKLMSRDIELSIIAANDAVLNSGLVTKAIDPEKVNVEPTRMAINIGASLISCDLIEISPAVAKSTVDGKFDILKWGVEGIEQITPLWMLKYLPNMLACHIGIIHDIQGPSNTITCAETSAHLAIGEAVQIIARGNADVALAGGAEAKVNPIIMIRQYLLKRMTLIEDNAESACRPFDAEAKGGVFGEGAGIVVLESLDNAQKRGAKIYAEVVGIGQSNNINAAYEKMEADGKGIRIAIEKAMADAVIRAEELDLIIPHGTAVAGDDIAEARAIEAALGQAARKIPVWPIKSMVSNTGAASGAIDFIAAAYAMKEGFVPAAKNFSRPAEGCNLNIVKEPLKKKIRYALCCGYSYCGQTAALVLKNIE